MTKTLKVLVTGATGKQGGAVARLLRERGHQVRALTRKSASPAAQALTASGIDVATGDLADRGSIDRALQGMDALFSVGTPFETGPEAETRQGVAAADAAAAARVHLVYSSVGSADQTTGVPHFDSKFAVEKHIRTLGVDATILAPVFFMENLFFGLQQLKQGTYGSPLTPDRMLAQVAVADIAAAALAAFEDRARYTGKRFDLAGDELTGNQSIEILSRVTGRPVRYFQVPLEMIRQAMGEDGAIMYRWFESTGYRVDREALRRELPSVSWTLFEAWARGQDWGALFAT